MLKMCVSGADQISFTTGQYYVRDMPVPFDIVVQCLAAVLSLSGQQCQHELAIDMAFKRQQKLMNATRTCTRWASGNRNLQEPLKIVGQ